MDLIRTVLSPHLLGRTLIWPGHLGASSFGFFGLYPSSLSKSAEFVSFDPLAGKALLVVYPMLSYSYDLPLELEFRGKCCVEKGAWRASYPQLCIILY